MLAIQKFIALMSSVLLIAAMPAAAQDADSETVEWHSNLARAQQEAFANDSIVLAYFHNRVAQPCWQLEQETFTDPEVRREMANAATVQVNIDQSPEIAGRFNLVKVPTVIFLNPNGKELDRAVGFKTPREFMSYLSRLTQGGFRSADLDTAAIDITQPRPGAQQVTLTAAIRGPRILSVVGDFNDWEPRNQLSQGDDGVWRTNIYLRPGMYEYKFLDGQGNYYMDEANPNRRINPDGYLNSALLVGNPKSSPIIEGNQVTFIVYRPEAQSVQLGGTFNNWELITMYRNPDDPAMWGVKYELPPGDYMYKYVIDGEWTHDPENYRPVDDDGYINSSFTIQ